MPRQGSITQYCIHELFVVQVGKEVFHKGARHLAFRAPGTELSSTEPHPSLRDVTCARSAQISSDLCQLTIIVARLQPQEQRSYD